MFIRLLSEARSEPTPFPLKWFSAFGINEKKNDFIASLSKQIPLRPQKMKAEDSFPSGPTADESESWTSPVREAELG